MRFALLCILAGSAAFATAASQAQPAPAVPANYVLLSNDYGGRSYIGLPIVGRAIPDEPVSALPAAAMSGGEISSTFASLCLAKLFDRDSYAAASKAAGLVSGTRELPYFEVPRSILLGTAKAPATAIVQEQASNGIASLWLGEGVDGLVNRQFLRYSGGIVITGPVKAQDFYAPQCNLTLHVSGLTSAQSLLDGIQAAAAGFTSTKRVEKPKYGYAMWTRPTDGGRIARIVVDANSLNKPSQIVHLTVQLLPPGKSK